MRDHQKFIETMMRYKGQHEKPRNNVKAWIFAGGVIIGSILVCTFSLWILKVWM